MPSFRQPDVEERKQAAIAAKQAMLNRFKAAASDPELEKRKAERTTSVWPAIRRQLGSSAMYTPSMGWTRAALRFLRRLFGGSNT